MPTSTPLRASPAKNRKKPVQAVLSIPVPVGVKPELEQLLKDYLALEPLDRRKIQAFLDLRLRRKQRPKPAPTRISRHPISEYGAAW
ncbi:hypothetical protein [Thiomonas sp.]